MKNITLVQKEQLKAVRFQKLEVLPEKPLRQNRQYKLNRAMILGNIDHNKVNIIFKTEDGSLQQVETTIWAVSEDHITLKGGVSIPVRAIIDLEF